MENILKIEETDFKLDNGESMSGIVIETNKQTIKFGISNGVSCCEDFGYFSTNDDIQEFTGAKLIDVKFTNTSRDTKNLSTKLPMYSSIDCAMFIDFITTKGTLQYAVYNEHNGYYGHTVVLSSTQLARETSL